MYVKLIIDMAIEHKGSSIPFNDGVRLLNDGIKFFASRYSTARAVENVEINAEADAWNSLPQSALRVEYVLDEKGRDVQPENYQVDLASKRGICFRYGGKHRVYYSRSPRLVFRETDEPDIHEQYQYALALYVAGKAILQITSDSRRGNDLLVESDMRAREVHNNLKSPKVVVIRPRF